jgi:hypothetical protein
MKVLKFTKRRMVVVLCAVVALAIAGSAYAYFTSTGTGTKSTAAIGTATNFNVTFGTATGTMFPGAGTDSIPYTVTNAGSGAQRLNTVTAVVANDATTTPNIQSGGVPVVGCLAAWFTATPPTITAVTLNPSPAAGSTSTGVVTVAMVDSGTNQNVCQGKTPDITISAS